MKQPTSAVKGPLLWRVATSDYAILRSGESSDFRMCRFPSSLCMEKYALQRNVWLIGYQSQSTKIYNLQWALAEF